jgi:hypothetical protein
MGLIIEFQIDFGQRGGRGKRENTETQRTQSEEEKGMRNEE